MSLLIADFASLAFACMTTSFPLMKKVETHLAGHWAPTFNKMPVSNTAIDEFIKNNVKPMKTKPIRMATFEDIANTLKFCPDSGVGPDGIPYSACRAAGAVGVLTLFPLYYHISSGQKNFLGFNDAYAVSLPKDTDNIDDTRLDLWDSKTQITK